MEPGLGYFLAKAAMPDLVKMGNPKREDTQIRINELFTSSVPSPSDSAYAASVQDEEIIFVKGYPLYFLLFFVFIFCNIHLSYAQKETSNWYFGWHAGIKFKDDTIKTALDGKLISNYGSSSISDKDGNLLFYTDGDTVYNRNHTPMPNGISIVHDNRFPTLAVPNPDDPSIYYLFCTDPWNFEYSIIDMDQNGGLGDVVSRNVYLNYRVVYGITAVLHANGKDIWVIVHEWDTTRFLSFLVTASGVTSTPVISSIGERHGFESDKQMKVSPDGTKLAATFSDGVKRLELFNYNTNNGKVTSMIFSIRSGSNDPLYYRDLVGVEFSPNSSILYATNSDSAGSNHLFQWNLNAGSPEDIKNSMRRIATPIKGGEENMQLGLDGKIYIVHGGGHDWEHLSRINQPNLIGVACDYREGEIDLGGRSAILKLPSFIQSYFKSPASMQFANGCISDSVVFSATSLGYYDSLKWDFGDPLSGGNNIARITNTKHKFSGAGRYDVTLITFISGFPSLKLGGVIDIAPIPVLDLGKDSAICDGTKVVLNVKEGYSYLWSTGEQTASISVKTEGTYKVTVSNGFCVFSDSIKIKVLELPKVDLPREINVCTKSVIVNGGRSSYDYLWSNGATTSEINIDKSGVYKLIVSNGQCYTEDSVEVVFYGLYDLKADIDKRSVSYNDPINFTAEGTEVVRWNWDFGDGNSSSSRNTTYIYQEEGEYIASVIATNKNNCSDTLSFSIEVQPFLFIPNVFTPNHDGVNDYFSIQYNGKEGYELKVYSRWGGQVFQSVNKNNLWSGENYSSGNYYYSLKVGKRDYNGWVSILK